MSRGRLRERGPSANENRNGSGYDLSDFRAVPCRRTSMLDDRPDCNRDIPSSLLPGDTNKTRALLEQVVHPAFNFDFCGNHTSSHNSRGLNCIVV